MASSLAWTLPGSWPAAMTDADPALADLDEAGLVDACLAGLDLHRFPDDAGR